VTRKGESDLPKPRPLAASSKRLDLSEIEAGAPSERKQEPRDEPRPPRSGPEQAQDADQTVASNRFASMASFGAPFGRGPILVGFSIIIFLCGSFAAWSLMAPLESAVVAPGVISVDSSVRTVQHLEGGIIEAILVREGDPVEAGQVLIRLQNTLSGSERNEILGQYFEARATEARLEAERDGEDSVTLPPDLREKVGDDALAAAIAGQISIFENRRALLEDRLTILHRTRAGLEIEIEGYEGQIRSSQRRRNLIEEELKDVLQLFEQQLTIKSRKLTLQRDQAELEGAISESRAAIGSARERIQQAELQMAELRASMATEVVEQLRETRARAYELHQRLTAAEDRMQRTEIRSPIAGVVVGLDVHTVGGVIAAGQSLLDVVPVSDKPVVQASINTLDIDQVEAGLPATVWLSAINRRTQSAIEGEVKTVSANRLIEPQTGRAYYLARIELDMEDVKHSTVPLQPGMSAEVMIRTGARTTWDYLTTPLSRSFSRAMREE
jgi:membrane fusion protein, epimerase transport system